MESGKYTYTNRLGTRTGNSSNVFSLITTINFCTLKTSESTFEADDIRKSINSIVSTFLPFAFHLFCFTQDLEIITF